MALAYINTAHFLNLLQMSQLMVSTIIEPSPKASCWNLTLLNRFYKVFENLS